MSRGISAVVGMIRPPTVDAHDFSKDAVHASGGSLARVMEPPGQGVLV